MSNNVVPEKLINFRAYNDGNDLLGVTDVQLPSLDAMTETVKGAGIAGEVDSPVLGHFGSMETVLNWRTISKPGMNLASQNGVSLDLRGAQQFYDPEKSEYVVKAVKCVIRGVPKKTELGKLDVGTTTGSSNTIETNYIKVIIAGETVLEVDKYNYIYLVNNDTGMHLIKKKEQYGKYVSIVPMSEEVVITLEGFKYCLNKYILKQGLSICQSNEVENDEASIIIHKGLAAIFETTD